MFKDIFYRGTFYYLLLLTHFVIQLLALSVNFEVRILWVWSVMIIMTYHGYCTRMIRCQVLLFVLEDIWSETKSWQPCQSPDKCPNLWYCELSYSLPWILWRGYGVLYNVCLQESWSRSPPSQARREGEDVAWSNVSSLPTRLSQTEKYSALRGQTVRKQNKSWLVNKITWYFTEDKFMGYLSCVVLTTLSPSH